jgi:predicted nicotinamide N-methyase
MVGRYETQVYIIPIAGTKLRLLGPRYPHALNDEPEMRRRFEADGYKPSWAQPWPAAVMLAEHVLRNASPGGGRVLELGAGLGIAGIALAMVGHRVVVSDYDDDALAFVRASAALNGVELDDVRRLDWRQPPAERFAMIVASDVAYEARHHAPIAALLAGCLEPGGQAFISDQNREAAEAFPGAVQAAGLTCEAFPASAKAIPAFDARDGRVFKGTVYRICWPQE